jgi:hypothetical protein
MAVNIRDDALESERGAWFWFEPFRNIATIKVDTGQNLRYRVQVLGSLLRALWDIIQSMFGYKEGFGLERDP